MRLIRRKGLCGLLVWEIWWFGEFGGSGHLAFAESGGTANALAAVPP